VCADKSRGSHGPLVADRFNALEWEKFDAHDMGDGKIALRACSTGQFVCADSARGSEAPLVADRCHASVWECFTPVPCDGWIALRAHNGKYVCADLHRSSTLVADRPGTDTWEQFKWVNEYQVKSMKVEANHYTIALDCVHTGIVMDGTEYYFHCTNHVERCRPGNGPGSLFGTQTVNIVDEPSIAMLRLQPVINGFNGTRYDLLTHNCNNFADAALRALSGVGIDPSHLNQKGIQKAVGAIPFTAIGHPSIPLLFEAGKLISGGNPRFDVAVADDVRKVPIVGPVLADVGTAAAKILNPFKW